MNNNPVPVPAVPPLAITPVTKGSVAATLAKCQSLNDAERLLMKFNLTRSVVWGLFDGFTGRPRVTSGLVSEVAIGGNEAARIAADYHEACEIGMRMGSCEEPV